MLSVCLLIGITISSCDVHEFPDPTPKEMEFVLKLNYDTNLPLYKIVEYEDDTRNKVSEEYDVRHIIKVFEAEAEGAEARVELYHFEFIEDDITELNTTVTLSIIPGNYNFIVWSDYVKEGNHASLHYDTNHFEEIALQGETHVGSDDFRDAFRGTVVSEVSDTTVEATVEMTRPMAKFNFVTTDVEDFIVKITSEGITPSSTNVDLTQYKAVFRYQGFMPFSYNMFTDKPADSKTGVSFESSLHHLSNGEAELGFDYVFVNGSESTMVVSVEIYDGQGNIVSNFKPVDVPLIRSKLTTVKARFLTSDAMGGVSIIPDYDGEHNIEIN